MFLGCIVLAALGWGRYYFSILSATTIGSAPVSRGILNLIPPLCLVLLFLVLKLFASHDVRDDVTYLLDEAARRIEQHQRARPTQHSLRVHCFTAFKVCTAQQMRGGRCC